MSNHTLNIQVDILRNEDTGFTYCGRSQYESSVYASSVSTAKSKLRPLVEKEILDALEEHQNYQRRVIACKGGEVLVVYFRNGQWGYDIAGPDRSYCSSYWGNDTFEQTVDRAIIHAEQSYGGVLWMC